MEMYNETDTNIVEETVYADFTCNNCDTPGARKISGTAGHSADIHPCPWCRCVLLDTDRPQGYDQTCHFCIFHRLDSTILTLLLAFTPRDDYDMLKQKFYFKNAPTRRQTSILANHGVQFSVLDYIPGWRPSLMTALDFMHCIYLG